MPMGPPAPIYAYVHLGTASQTVTGGTPTKCNFNTVISDTVGAYDATTNYRYTAKRAGTYHVTVIINIQVGTGSTTVMNNAYIYKNGAAYAHNGVMPYNTNSTNISVMTHSLVPLNGTTDYVEGWGMASGTGSPTFLLAASGVVSSMSVFWVGP